MSDWKIVVPEATTNLLSDPSFALADPDTEWSILGDGAGGEDYTRSTTYSYFGFSSAEATLGLSAWALIYQTITTTATSYTLSARVRRSGGGVPTATHTRAYFDDAAVAWDSITSVGNGWYLCVYTNTATAAANSFGVLAYEASLYVDAVQLENKAYRTTYCDGGQPGCSWRGPAHASESSRTDMTREGGRVYDLEDDYSLEVVDWQGWGVPSNMINLDSYAILPGAQINSIKTDVNVLTLTGYFQGTSMANLHTLRQALVEELAHDRYPATSAGWQPIILRYTGAAVWKQAYVFYDSGLEGASMLKRAFTERIPIRFLMADPYWYEIGESAAVLDTNDSATLRYFAGRLTSTGQWDTMGLTADPTAAGTIYAICVASDSSVYVGGNFDGLNNNGAPANTDAETDYIARYDPEDEYWYQLVGNNDVNGIVYDIKEGPDGIIYLCGAFTAVNGVGTADYIVSYDPAADTWASLGDPESGAAAITSCRAMAFDSTGNLYVVGEFTNFNDVAAADYIAVWDGAAWAAVGAPSVGAGFPVAIAVDIDDNVYIGGSFTNFAGDADADGIAWWNGAAWADLEGTTLAGNATVNSIAYDPALGLFFAGDFINAGGEADADYIFVWNGTAVIPLSSGLNAAAEVVAIAPDDTIWATGNFTQAGTLTVSRYALWNGSTWILGDLATGAIIYAVAFGVSDAVVRQNYDIFVGLNSSAATQFAGSATVTNAGTTPQYPRISIERSGGTTAEIGNIRNEDTGRLLALTYTLLDGETLEIDCRPGQKTVMSSFSVFYGVSSWLPVAGGRRGRGFRRPEALRASADLGTFALQMGANQITALVYVEGAPTVTARMIWKDAYRGMD